MNVRIVNFLMVLVVLFLVGCGPKEDADDSILGIDPPVEVIVRPLPEIWTIRDENIPGNPRDKMESFETGHYPAFVILGCRGWTVSVRVVENYQGTTKYEVSHEMDADPGFIQIEGMEKGAYTVHLLIDDRIAASNKFQILR